MSIIAYVLVGLIASLQDIKNREVSDWLHIAIIAIGIFNFSMEGLMACIIAFSLFILPNIINENAIGGADIKFMAASGLVLGVKNILIASGIGITIAVIFILINNIIKKDKLNAVPLIPYLFSGCMISLSTAFFI